MTELEPSHMNTSDKIDKDLIDPAIEPTSEKVHRFARAGIGVFPMSGTALEMFNSIIEPPMERRKTKWMIQVSDVLNRLLDSGIVTEESLQNNEAFFTTLVLASSAALKNHQIEKLEALKFAVLNSALPNAPEESRQQLFLNSVEASTAIHLTLLKYFQSPADYADEKEKPIPKAWSMGTRIKVIKHVFPEWCSEELVIHRAINDLYQMGFICIDYSHMNTKVTRLGLTGKQTTVLGDEFISFVTDRVL